jgi:hypothetical protein
VECLPEAGAVAIIAVCYRWIFRGLQRCLMIAWNAAKAALTVGGVEVR